MRNMRKLTEYEIFKVFEKMEMDQKYEKRTYNLRKPINKLRFKKFLKKSETDQKKEETVLKI